jgi:histidinol-phosphate aminotransferase
MMVQAQGGVNRVVPLKEMSHHFPAILKAITDRTRLIFLDNPNNPTGTAFSAADFEAFLAAVPDYVIVVLDEAYVDFVDADLRLDVHNYLYKKTPVVALRTFSKAYGLAGLRIGYGLMREELAGYLHRLRQPFNVNQLAQIGALAALDDEEHYQQTLTVTTEGMIWLHREIARLGCRPLPSQANFFLVDIGGSGKKLYERMLTKGVIIRPMHAYGYPNYIRITVGLPEENERLVRAMAEALQELGYGRG